MIGNGIIMVDSVDGSPLPSTLEYGITTNPYILPAIAQSSPIFAELPNGVYYVFYRKKGTIWSIQNVLIDVVDCTKISSITNSKTLKNVLFSIVNESSIKLLEDVISSSVMVFVEGRKIQESVTYSYNQATSVLTFESDIVNINDSLIEIVAETISTSNKHFKSVSFTLNSGIIAISENVTVGSVMLYVEGRKLSEGVHYSYNSADNIITFLPNVIIIDQLIEIIAEVETI